MISNGNQQSMGSLVMPRLNETEMLATCIRNKTKK